MPWNLAGTKHGNLNLPLNKVAIYAEGRALNITKASTTSQDYQITLSNFCTKENIPKEIR